MVDHTNKNSQNEVFLLDQENLSYAFVKKEVEEPIPFAGIMKFVEYGCPICETKPDNIRDYRTE